MAGDGIAKLINWDGIRSAPYVSVLNECLNLRFSLLLQSFHTLSMPAHQVLCMACSTVHAHVACSTVLSMPAHQPTSKYIM